MGERCECCTHWVAHDTRWAGCSESKQVMAPPPLSAQRHVNIAHEPAVERPMPRTPKPCSSATRSCRVFDHMLPPRRHAHSARAQGQAQCLGWPSEPSHRRCRFVTPPRTLEGKVVVDTPSHVVNRFDTIKQGPHAEKSPDHLCAAVSTVSLCPSLLHSRQPPYQKLEPQGIDGHPTELQHLHDRPVKRIPQLRLANGKHGVRVEP